MSAKSVNEREKCQRTAGRPAEVSHYGDERALAPVRGWHCPGPAGHPPATISLLASASGPAAASFHLPTDGVTSAATDPAGTDRARLTRVRGTQRERRLVAVLSAVLVALLRT